MRLQWGALTALLAAIQTLEVPCAVSQAEAVLMAPANAGAVPACSATSIVDHTCVGQLPQSTPCKSPCMNWPETEPEQASTPLQQADLACVAEQEGDAAGIAEQADEPPTCSSTCFAHSRVDLLHEEPAASSTGSLTSRCLQACSVGTAMRLVVQGRPTLFASSFRAGGA